MKRLLFVSCAAIAFGFAAPAVAADLPVKGVPGPAMVAAPAPLFDWTGFYVGAHVGYGWGDSSASVVETDNLLFPRGFAFDTDIDGILGGLQTGFNYQTGIWVFGVEGQYSWSGMDGESSTLNPGGIGGGPPAGTRRVDGETDVNWVATLTGRLGVAAGNSLWYVKGGGAWLDFDSKSRVFNTVLDTQVNTVRGGDTLSGWTVGAGVEWAWAPNWSAKLEYNYLDFGEERVTFRDDAGRVSRDIESDMHVIKFGINYRFGAPGKAPAPIMTRG